MRNVKALDALRLFRQIQRILQCLANCLRRRLQNSESLFERMLRVALHEIEESPLGPALRRKDFQFVSCTLRQSGLQQFPIVKVRRYVNRFGQIIRLQVKLLQKRRHKLLRVKLFQLFPVEFAAIHHTPAAQVKKVGSNERRFGVISKYVRVISLCRGNALAFFNVFQRPQQIAVGGRVFEQLLLRRCGHPLFETLDQIVPAPFKKHAHIARGFRIAFVRRQSGHARPKAPLDVVLQASPRVAVRQIHRAGRNQEPLVNKMQNAACQARWKIRTEID